jgi:hypothetical protein
VKAFSVIYVFLILMLCVFAFIFIPAHKKHKKEPAVDPIDVSTTCLEGHEYLVLRTKYNLVVVPKFADDGLPNPCGE